LIGTGINGNNYKINGFEFYCFDVFDIDKQEYLSPSDRVSFITENAIKHVPVLASEQSISELGSEYNDICSKLLDVATAKTVMKSSDVLREGLVFKSHERNKHSDIVHFKVISNEWLLKYE
jgi:ATP-dependent RNA circularization protein (DNA/RNA ligase family)